MRRRWIVLAVLTAVLLGAGTAVRGGDDDEVLLVNRLRQLQDRISELLRLELAQRVEAPMVGAGHELTMFPVRDLAAGIPSYGSPVGAAAEETPQLFGSGEELVELLRSNVSPDAWESGTLTAYRGVVTATNTRDVLKQIDAYLATLRKEALRCVSVELEVVDVAGVLAGKLAEARGDALRQAVDAAIGAGTARSVLATRVTGLLGQRVFVSHGTQVGVRADAGELGVVPDGGSLAVRVTAAPEGRLDVELDASYDEVVRPLPANGSRPEVRRLPVSTRLAVADGGWAIAGSGPRDGANGARMLLVRATLLAWGGAR